jgi:hypothetical protein
MKLEDKKLIIKKILRKCFLLVFLIFTVLYISEGAGYFEYSQHKNMVLTSEKIQEFEEDVKNGKNIDIENYVDVASKDYSNKVSNLGLDISELVNDFVIDGFNSLFKYLGGMAK